MKRFAIALVLIAACTVFVCSCTQPPNTQDIDKDILSMTAELTATKAEYDKYVGGVVKSLIALRLEILNNTLAMLKQKKTGINRFINVNFTIDGKAYLPPANKEEQIKKIDEDIIVQENELVKAMADNEQYGGGLIKAMIIMRIESIRNIISNLEAKKLYLKHDIPNFISKSDGKDASAPEFKTTPGSDSDKL